jgi:hypothetical protein
MSERLGPISFEEKMAVYRDGIHKALRIRVENEVDCQHFMDEFDSHVATFMKEDKDLCQRYVRIIFKGVLCNTVYLDLPCSFVSYLSMGRVPK